MEAAEHSWRPLGELLVQKGLVTEDELEKALAEQAESGRLLGAILVARGFVSGPALAIALAEQYGVELKTERGFGTGLWAEIDRRHRAGRGRPEDDEEDNVVVLEQPVKLTPVEPRPDPQLELVQDENQRLREQIEALQAEYTRLRVVEVPPEPEPASAHVLFVPTPSRYVLVERNGAPPEAGEELELPEGRFVVSKLGRAPLPGEHRPCAFLSAVAG